MKLNYKEIAALYILQEIAIKNEVIIPADELAQLIGFSTRNALRNTMKGLEEKDYIDIEEIASNKPKKYIVKKQYKVTMEA